MTVACLRAGKQMSPRRRNRAAGNSRGGWGYRQCCRQIGGKGMGTGVAVLRRAGPIGVTNIGQREECAVRGGQFWVDQVGGDA